MAAKPVGVPPHIRALCRMVRDKVDFVLIGLTAINFYARDPSAMSSTLDCDVLLMPEARNLRRAVRAVLACGYKLSAGGEPLPRPDGLTLRRLLERRAVIRAVKPRSLAVDLVLLAGPREYARWRRGRCIFQVCGRRVAVGGLPQLVKAKEAAGRPKDIEFLRTFRARLSEFAG